MTAVNEKLAIVISFPILGYAKYLIYQSATSILPLKFLKSIVGDALQIYQMISINKRTINTSNFFNSSLAPLYETN